MCSVQCAMFLRLDSYHYSVKDRLTCTARLHCTTFFVTMQDICGWTVQYCTVLHCCTVLNCTLLHCNMHITALQYSRVYAWWRNLCRRADTAQTHGPPSPFVDTNGCKVLQICYSCLLIWNDQSASYVLNGWCDDHGPTNVRAMVIKNKIKILHWTELPLCTALFIMKYFWNSTVVFFLLFFLLPVSPFGNSDCLLHLVS